MVGTKTDCKGEHGRVAASELMRSHKFSILHRLLMPPLYSERLTPAQWKTISVGRIVMATAAFLFDLVILVAMRGNPKIDQRELWFFGVNNISIMFAVALLSLAMLRLPALRKTGIVMVSAVFEVFTLIVWVQATGSVTSYFLVTAFALLAVYRMFLGYWVALAVTASLVVFHSGAVILEMTGLLRPEALFVGHPSQVYTVADYHGFAIASITSAYVVIFLGLNAVANKMHEREQALAEVRREAARVAQEVKHGRLTGTLLAEEYALGEVLGRGGMGEIYVARRISDDQTVAVKVLHGHLVGDPTHLERFRREAAAAERVPHRYTARILEVGSDPPQHLHFIVMEYLRGEDLAAYLRRRGPLDPSELVPLARGIAEVLDAAHAVQLIHRDLKPQNVFLVDRDSDRESSRRQLEVRLLDFGMSKILDSDEQTLTQTDAVIGTLAYMAPEQALGRHREVGPAADRFAFAAIVYRALTGKLPFQSTDLLSAIREIVNGEPPPPSSLRPHLHRDVDAVLAIGMAKRIEDRYDSAAALVVDLEAAAGGNLNDTARQRASAVAAILDEGHAATVDASSRPL